MNFETINDQDLWELKKNFCFRSHDKKWRELPLEDQKNRREDSEKKDIFF